MNFFGKKKSSEIWCYPKQKKKVSRFLLKVTKDTTENQKWPQMATNIVYIGFLNGKNNRFFFFSLKKNKTKKTKNSEIFSHLFLFLSHFPTQFLFIFQGFPSVRPPPPPFDFLDLLDFWTLWIFFVMISSL